LPTRDKMPSLSSVDEHPQRPSLSLPEEAPDEGASPGAAAA